MNPQEAKQQAESLIEAHKKAESEDWHARQFYHHVCDMHGETIAQAYIQAYNLIEDIRDTLCSGTHDALMESLAKAEEFLAGDVNE